MPLEDDPVPSGREGLRRGVDGEERAAGPSLSTRGAAGAGTDEDRHTEAGGGPPEGGGGSGIDAPRDRNERAGGPAGAEAVDDTAEAVDALGLDHGELVHQHHEVARPRGRKLQT